MLGVRFYGLASSVVEEVIDFYPSRKEAEAALAEVLSDEPEWAGVLSVVAVDLPEGGLRAN